MPISLLCLIPNLTDATSFYRGVGPLGALRRSMDLNLVFMTEINWASLKLCDGVFMQRPYSAAHRTIAEMCNEYNKPLWVDFDDDLLSVPEDNPNFDVYSGQETKKCIAEIAARANVMTVSTAALKRKLTFKLSSGQRLNRQVFVVPNAWDEEVCDPDRELLDEERKLIIWRGSKTHNRDLFDYRESIVDLAIKHPDWVWTFIGFNPWFITENMPENTCLSFPAMDIKVYLNQILQCQPALQIVPLSDNEFNRSKSNIAWIEGSWSGAAAVAPDWEEWRRPGIVNYKNPESFYRVMKDLMELSPKRIREEFTEKSMAYIRENLLLNKINVARENIINGMRSYAKGNKA